MAKRAMPKSTVWEQFIGAGKVVSHPPEIVEKLGAGGAKVQTLLMPRALEELQELLQYCNANRAPLYTAEHFKLGSAPQKLPEDYIALSLAGLDKKISIKEESLTVEITGGITAKELETRLAREDLMLLHPLPPCPADSIIEKLSLCASYGANGFAEGVCELAISSSGLLPKGAFFGGVRAPRSAAGPDLDSMFSGTGNTLGILTGVALRLKKIPSDILNIRYTFEEPLQALTFAREFFQRGALCDVLYITVGAKKTEAAMKIYSRGKGLSEAIKDFGAKLAESCGGESCEDSRGFKWEADILGNMDYGLWAAGYWKNISEAITLKPVNVKSRGGAKKGGGKKREAEELQSALAIKDSLIVITSCALEGARIGVIPNQGRSGFSDAEKKAFCAAAHKFCLRLMPGVAPLILGAKAYPALFGDASDMYKKLKKVMDPAGYLNPNLLMYPSL